MPNLPGYGFAEMQRIAHAKAFFAARGYDIRHGGNRTFYKDAEDRIQTPHFETFAGAEAYDAAHAHEATHRTGLPARCASDLKGRFGENVYAAEELIAEPSTKPARISA